LFFYLESLPLLKNTDQQEARLRMVLTMAGLVRLQDRMPNELSGGEQQRVAVARALVGKPTLLLGDEPTGNLDNHTAETMYQLMREVHQRHHLTSIIVTHNHQLASQCDVEKHLRDGRLV